MVPAQKRYYLPDWYKEGIILETKGRLTSQDRKKMLLIQEQHPDKTIIMIFGAPGNRLSKKSQTTYSDWCQKNNILWCGIDEFEENPKLCLSNLIKNSKLGQPKISRTRKRKS